MTDREQAARSLAADILSLARGTLTVKLRYMDRALGALEPKCVDEPFFASDGRYLYYEPWYVLGQYKAESANVARDYLHTLLHCVFRHGLVSAELDRARWDLACDVAVEDMIAGLRLPELEVRRAKAQSGTLAFFRGELGSVTAERIYAWLGEKALQEAELERMREPFFADAHGVWYGGDGDGQEEMQLVRRWEQVSKRMERELELLLSDRDSALVQSLRRLNRKKQDYAAFLRRFGVMGERLALSEEEFDNNYYMYGQSLHPGLALIEPLEYSERRLIRDFVIAIDTSGSVRGDVVQSFIQKTYDILSERESFASRLRLHIIQCDDRIREDALICSGEDFESYMRTMEIKGLGNTDLRPVFEYVDALIERRELTRLRGLIYFTDGRGRFPERRPRYDTAFILSPDGREPPPAPDWAAVLELNEAEGDMLERRL